MRLEMWAVDSSGTHKSSEQFSQNTHCIVAWKKWLTLPVIVTLKSDFFKFPVDYDPNGKKAYGKQS